MNSTAWFAAYAPLFGALGAILGSFLNVCISRWPKEESVVRPRSRCPGCGAAIAWYDNVPIVSWLVLRARCRHCGQPISWQYPLVEATTALIWIGALWLLGPSLLAVRLAVVTTILLGVAVTDAQSYLIPDGFTLTGLAVAGVGALAGALIGEQLPFAGPWQAILGACVGAGAITIIGWLGEVALKKEAMGYGDATLMAFVGAMLGPERALLSIFVGAALAAGSFLLVVYPIGWWRARRAGAEFAAPLVPFGVFLAPAAVVTLLFGNALLTWYFRQIVG
ncbi:MAG: prepilin peptidase [Gemmatimonadaceae bacterium]|nr:prepilin peptidase [Gemmatimonadaceae bacterium]